MVGFSLVVACLEPATEGPVDDRTITDPPTHASPPSYPLSPEDRARLVDPEERDCAPLVGFGRAHAATRPEGWLCATPEAIAALHGALQGDPAIFGSEESWTPDGCTAGGRAYQAVAFGAYCDGSSMHTPPSSEHLLDFQTRCGPLFDAPIPGGEGHCCVWVGASRSCDVPRVYP